MISSAVHKRFINWLARAVFGPLLLGAIDAWFGFRDAVVGRED